jgi:hypothetical protein
MRVSLWPVLVVLVAAASAAFARGDEERDAEIGTCIAALASKDDAERTKAAARLVELGPKAVDRVAREGTSLGADAWTSFADACAAGKNAWYGTWLRAAARSAPEAHAKRLLELARRIDPEGSKARTKEQIAAVAREYLIERRNERCCTGHDTEVAALGHDAVPLVISMIRDAKSMHTDVSSACGALSIVADADDVPALRELLLAGETRVAHPLASLQARGVTSATDALFEAVAAGQFDDDIARALEEAPDRARTVKAVRTWFAEAPAEKVTGDARLEAVRLFGRLGARDTARLVESWIPLATKDYEFTQLAAVLTGFGSREGLALSLRIATERRTRFPCMNPPTEKDIADDVARGLLPCNGFHPIDRWDAARRLGEIAAGAVKVPTHEEWMEARGTAYRAGRETPNEADALDRIAVELRAWWDTSKDKLTFDAASGKWSVGK